MTATRGDTAEPATSAWRRATAMEAAGWVSTARWLLRRPRVRVGSTAVPYIGNLRALLGVFIALSALEVVVLDLVLRPWPGPRFILLALGLWGLLFMVGMTTGMTVNPHDVGPKGLRLRYGALVDIDLPWRDVEYVAIRRHNHASNQMVQVQTGADGDTVSLPIQSQTQLEVGLFDPLPLMLPARHVVAQTVRIAADNPALMLHAVRQHMPGP